MRFFSALMPREARFFALFNRHAQCIVDGGDAVVKLVNGYSDQKLRAELIQQIGDIERAADKVTYETVSLLHSTFITPFDRMDIHRLISGMDDILDLMQDVAETIVLYDIRKITPESRQLAEICQMCCERVRTAVSLLKNVKDVEAILKTCQEIDRLESDADRVMRSAMSKLVRDEADVKQLIKLRTIYELLEQITDRCEDVANIIEGIVLENS